jgi:hypothetical protein
MARVRCPVKILKNGSGTGKLVFRMGTTQVCGFHVAVKMCGKKAICTNNISVGNGITMSENS